jgi:hypothetical protein
MPEYVWIMFVLQGKQRQKSQYIQSDSKGSACIGWLEALEI